MPLCVPFSNSSIDCYFIIMAATIIGNFMAILLILINILGLSVTSADTNLLGCFWTWTFHLNSELSNLLSDFYVLFRFYTRIFYREVSCFATDWSCGVWFRGLTTCLLYVDPRFGNRVCHDSRFVSLTWWRTMFPLFSLCFYTYLNVSRYDNTLFSFALLSFLE